MSIEKIRSRILGEAEAERDITLAEARARSEAVLAEAEKNAATLLADAERRGKIEKDKIITRRKSVADIDCRKVFLAKKQEIIEACFARAIDEITDMPKAAYIELLVHLGKISGVKAGVLIFNERDKQSVAAEVCRALNEAVDCGSFIVSEKTGKMRGGYLLNTGNVTVNNTIEALVSEAKSELTAETAKLLFPTE